MDAIDHFNENTMGLVRTRAEISKLKG
jgi:hypothetical protein